MRNLLKEQPVKFGLRAAPERGHVVLNSNGSSSGELDLVRLTYFKQPHRTLLSYQTEYFHLIINRSHDTYNLFNGSTQ